MYRLYFPILIGFILIFASCGQEKKIPVSELQEKRKQWIPFNKFDKIKYKNKEGEKIEFEFTEETLQKTTKHDELLNEQGVIFKGALKSKKYFNTDNYIYDYLVYLAQSDGLGDNERITFNIFDCAVTFNPKPLSLSKYKQKGQRSFIHKELVVDNIVYNNVIEMVRDTSSTYLDNNTCTIWRVLIAEGYGIIKFHDRKNHDEWTLVEENVASVDSFSEK